MRQRKKDLKSKISDITKKIFFLIKNFNFKVFNLTLPRATTIIGAFLGIISLFIPWIINNKSNTNWNSFSSVSGNVGYLLILLFIIIIFITFGSNYKEKMKLYSEIDFKNYVIILFTGILMFIISFIVSSFSVGLETFEKDIKYGNGLALSIVSAIFLITGGYLTKKDFEKNSSEIILEKLNQERNKEKKKDNLSLPF